MASWGDEASPWDSLAIGTAIEGGYYAGQIVQDDGRYALIVAPKSSETSLALKTSNTATSGTISLYDGLSNCLSADTAEHPAVQYCLNYSTGGYTDWYLPARDELEICYRNLKPHTDSNVTGPRADGGQQGQNENSHPVGAPYTTTVPGQTEVTDFQSISGTGQSFVRNYYLTSTEYLGETSWRQRFNSGFQSTATKLTEALVRPIRRVKI